MQDPNVTERMRIFLEADGKDLAEGADILLIVSGNRIRHKMYIRDLKRYADDIVRRVRELYGFRLAKLTHEQVAEMAQKAKEAVSNAQADEDSYRAGKRPDHDDLPQDIQAAYVQALDCLHKERELHLQIRRIALAQKPAPCADSEMFPFLKEIIKIDRQRLALWQKYDSFSK